MTKNGTNEKQSETSRSGEINFTGRKTMRPYLSVKSLLRTPFKTFLTLILLTAVTFALFSRISEYTITNREINNAAKEYCGVGSAEIAPASESYTGFPFYIYADPRMSQDFSEEKREYYLDSFRYRPLSHAQIDSILGLPYITSSNICYMTAGISDKYYRIDEGEDYYNYTTRYIVEGTLSEVNYNILYARSNNDELTLTDCTLLAGDPSYLPKNKKITFHNYPKDVSSFGNGSRALITYDDNYKYDTDYIKNLTIGSRYVFVGRFEPLGDPIRFFLSDQLTNPWCEAIKPIEGQPENYLEGNQFSSLRELIELTDSDLHTFDVVYTDDISSIMRFAEGDMAVTSGRGLTKEDSINKSNVCVVSGDFASQNKLDLGDKITLGLGDQLFEQYKGLGAVAVTRERYSPPVKTVELQIVGIYMDTDGLKSQSRKPNWCYSINTVFVPKSLLPVDEGKLEEHVFSPSEFSFKVGNAWEITSFVDKVIPMIKEMGLTPFFYDDGWPEIVEQFKISKKLSVIAIIALFGAMAAAIGFIVFLFIGRKKKEYAIMRALGTTKKDSAGALILPLIVLTATSVLIGSCAAWIYTTNTIAQNDTLSKIESYAVNSSVPVVAAIAYMIGEIFLVLIFALIGLRRIGAIPPLMLLQDNQNKQMHRREQAHNNMLTKSNGKPVDIETIVDAESLVLIETSVTNMPDVSKQLATSNYHIHDASVLNTAIFSDPYAVQKINPQRSWKQVFRYISKHVRRSAGKSILAILLSALLIAAVGQFAVMRQSYVELCNSTVIKAKFINGLSLTNVTQILKTGYVINPYYEYKKAASFNDSTTDLVITNDIERYTGEEAEIIYTEGYDASCMKELGRVCIVGSKLLEENGLKPGDKVIITTVWSS